MENKEQENTTLPPETSSIPEQPTKKPKPKWLVPFIVVVGVIILGLAAWAGYNYWLKPTIPEEQPTEKQQEELDEFADWKTYKNEEYGFEFKYPSDFIVKDAGTMIFAFETPDSEFQELYNDYYKQNFSFRMNGAEFYIGASINEEKPTLAEWIESGLVCDSGIACPVKSVLNNQTVMESEFEGWGAPTNDVHQFLNFLEENKKNTEDFYPYRKSFSFYNEKTGVSVGISIETIVSKKVDYNPVFEKILSTFKFIDETADWKIYRSDEYGFEVKYPGDWNISEEELSSPYNYVPLIVNLGNDEYNFSIKVNFDDPQGYIYLTDIKETVTVDGKNYTAYIFPKGYECYGPSDHTEEDMFKNCSFFVIPIKHNDIWYLLSASRNVKSIEGIYETILSLFKFIDVDEIVAQKIYRNEKYGFEFKYPANWFHQRNDLSPQEIEYYEIGSDNAPIHFGISSKDPNVFLNDIYILNFGKIEYQIENSERNKPDSTMIIDDKEFKIYDLIDYGRYEGASAGNVLLIVGPELNIENKILYLVFEWEQYPGAQNILSNSKEDFLDMISTLKFIN